LVKYECRGQDPSNPCGIKEPGPACQKRGRFSQPCFKLTVIPDRQSDLVKDFGFPNMPKCPCLSCGEYEKCRKTDSFLGCDEYLQWRKERGFGPISGV